MCAVRDDPAGDQQSRRGGDAHRQDQELAGRVSVRRKMGLQIGAPAPAPYQPYAFWACCLLAASNSPKTTSAFVKNLPKSDSRNVSYPFVSLLFFINRLTIAG